MTIAVTGILVVLAGNGFIVTYASSGSSNSNSSVNPTSGYNVVIVQGSAPPGVGD